MQALIDAVITHIAAEWLIQHLTRAALS